MNQVWQRNILNVFHQVADARSKGIGNCLNRKQGWIFHPTFDSAEKGPVNVGFGGKSLLGQLLFQPHFPNLLSELFCNIVAHAGIEYPDAVIMVCRL
jgi:hypothetical protein